MAHKKRKLKRKVRIKQQARLIHKNDATRVAKPQTLDTIPRMKARMPADVGVTFKIKVKKKLI